MPAFSDKVEFVIFADVYCPYFLLVFKQTSYALRWLSTSARSQPCNNFHLLVFLNHPTGACSGH